LLPSEGIYATYSIVNGIKYPSVSFLGHRVSTDGKYAIETYILDVELKEIHPHIEIEFVKRIRENQKYDDMEKLKNQILEDIEVARKILI